MTRGGRFAAVSTALTLLSDREVARLVETATPASSGVLTVAGTPVFVKKVPLTELERRPEHIRSTANLFGLPPWCQYGVGSPGFGVWRELAAHVMTTNWVLSGECANFPLLYHWRVVDTPPPVSADLADIDRFVEYWHDGPGVRARAEALVAAEAGVVLFLEHFPHTLDRWLSDRLAAGDIAGPCAMVERDLLGVTAFLDRRDLFHFDAHFGNILTDGERLYFGDLGLATSPRFDLSPAEREFLTHNAGYDSCCVLTHLVYSLVRAFGDADGDPAERQALARGFTDDADFPAAAADIVRRYRPIAVPFNDFLRDLFDTSRQTPYPRGLLGNAPSV